MLTTKEIELLTFIKESLCACIAILEQNEVAQFDTTVNNLESIIGIIEVEGSVNSFAWADNIIILIRNSVEVFESEMIKASEDLLETPKNSKRIEIPASLIEQLLFMKFSVPKIAQTLGVSVRTVRRRMTENDLSVNKTYSNISQDELNNVIARILILHPNTGCKLMKGYLWHYDSIRVPENVLRQTMRIVDPLGVHQRYYSNHNRALKRRKYFVKFANSLWHVDTNMKLIRYSMIIRGCIDGKSRFGIYLDIGDNNRAASSLESFKSATDSYGVPSRVRSDKGKENVLIARFMLSTRGLNRGSHLTGRSVNNQRIERFWGDINKATAYFYDVFAAMEEEGILDIDNPNHMFVLHYVFLPRIQRTLDNVRSGWNLHPLSSEGNDTPQQLMIEHRPPSEEDLLMAEDTVQDIYRSCQTYQDLNYFDEEVEDGIRNPSRIVHTLSDKTIERLRNVDVLEKSYNNGANILQHCLNLIASCEEAVSE